MLIDTHAHLTDRKFTGDLDEVIRRAGDEGIRQIIDVGESLASSLCCVEHARRYRGVFASAGIHPHNAGDVAEGDLQTIAQLADERRVVAVGETGLDFYRSRADRDAQESLFGDLLSLAAGKGLPAIVHCRDAYARLKELLGGRRGGPLTGVIHCFSGSGDDAEVLTALGFYVSFGGPLTYPGNESLREAARRVPLERLLLETDAPYLPPQGQRGKRNEPANVALVAAALARVRGMSGDDVATITTANARRLFNRMDDSAIGPLSE